MSLRTRLALVGVAVLATTLLVVAGLAYQLSRVQGRAAVDRVLRQELDDLSAGLPDLLDEGTGGAGPSVAELQAAAERYLAVHPGSDRHLTVITIGADRLTTRDGPESILELIEDASLPAGRPGELRTFATDEGPVRLLTADLRGRGGAPVGRLQVLGPLDEVLDDARNALLRVATAGVAGLLLGGVALTVATGRALTPLTRLAVAARTTGSGTTGARVPEPSRRDEVGVVAHEFNRMLDRLDVDAERRRHLLASISHELRTPVSVASGHLDVFEAIGPTDEQSASELAAVVRAELARLTRIIDDLSAVARGALGADLDVGPVFLPDLFGALRNRVAGLGLVDVVVEVPEPLVVEADADRLTQCLLNLVLNADVHTPAGTAVRTGARRSGADVVLEVVDEGPGMDPAIAERAFEPFVTSRTGGQGRTTGLGLHVVRTLTEAHGGTASLTTSPAGTAVSLRLPLPAGGDVP